MTIEVRCPQCEALLRLNDASLLGSVRRCPKCKERVLLPDVPDGDYRLQAQPEPEPEPSSLPPPIRRKKKKPSDQARSKKEDPSDGSKRKVVVVGALVVSSLAALGVVAALVIPMITARVDDAPQQTAANGDGGEEAGGGELSAAAAVETKPVESKPDPAVVSKAKLDEAITGFQKSRKAAPAAGGGESPPEGDRKLWTIKFPYAVSVMNPDKGEVLGIGGYKPLLVLSDPARENVTRSCEMRPESLPYGAVYKRFGERSFWITKNGKEDLHTIIDAETLQVLGQAGRGNRLHVSGPASPEVYFAATKEDAVGLDTTEGEQVKCLPELHEKSGLQFVQRVQLIEAATARDSLVYFQSRGNAGRFATRIDRSAILQREFLRQATTGGVKKELGQPRPDDYEAVAFCRSKVFKADLSSQLGEFPFEIEAVADGLPWVIGADNANLLFGSLNTYETVGRIPIPEANLSENPKVRDQPFRGPIHFDPVHKSVVVQGNGHLTVIPLETVELPPQPLLRARIDGPRECELGQAFVAEVTPVTGGTAVQLGRAPEGVELRESLVVWQPRAQQAGNHVIELKLSKDGHEFIQPVYLTVRRPRLETAMPLVSVISNDESKLLAYADNNSGIGVGNDDLWIVDLKTMKTTARAKLQGGGPDKLQLAIDDRHAYVRIPQPPDSGITPKWKLEVRDVSTLKLLKQVDLASASPDDAANRESTLTAFDGPRVQFGDGSDSLQLDPDDLSSIPHTRDRPPIPQGWIANGLTPVIDSGVVVDPVTRDPKCLWGRPLLNGGCGWLPSGQWLGADLSHAPPALRGFHVGRRPARSREQTENESLELFDPEGKQLLASIPLGFPCERKDILDPRTTTITEAVRGGTLIRFYEGYLYPVDLNSIDLPDSRKKPLFFRIEQSPQVVDINGAAEITYYLSGGSPPYNIELRVEGPSKLSFNPKRGADSITLSFDPKELRKYALDQFRSDFQSVAYRTGGNGGQPAPRTLKEKQDRARSMIDAYSKQVDRINAVLRRKSKGLLYAFPMTIELRDQDKQVVRTERWLALDLDLKGVNEIVGAIK